MKRTRDDVFPVSQFKRPFGSSGEAYGQTPSLGGVNGVGVREAGERGVGSGAVGIASHKLTTDDALNYLKEVKKIFENQREKYETFLSVMKDFKAQRADTADVILRVKELFKEHKNLIYGFNAFLPKGFEITLDEDDVPPKKLVEFQEAISLVNKIKKRFQTEDHVYKSFLDILNMYRKHNKDINEVHREVSALFLGHPDLLEDFMRFLPDVSEATHQGPHARKQGQRHYEQSSGASMQRQVRSEKQHRNYQTIVANGYHDGTSSERPDYEYNKGATKMGKELRRRAEIENRNRRNHGRDDMDIEQDNDRHLSDKGKVDKKVESYGAFNGCTSFDEQGIYGQACVLCEKVKERLCSQEDYLAFLKCLDIFSSGIIKRDDLQSLVTDLLGKYPDLMEEFDRLLKQRENIDGFLSSIMNKKSPCVDGHINQSPELEDEEKDQNHDTEADKEKERCKEKYWAKSIQELDLSDCQRCTPSYRLLPDDYPIPLASQRSELGDEVLNDHWVSVTSGSEDYSFKHMRRNQFEESLFRCEDDRFELDILLENVNSAAKHGEILLKSIIEREMDRPVRVEDYFTAMNLRCIERIYGDHGLDVIDVLQKNPALALPVILPRLKQKQEEWSFCRGEFNKVWADVYAKNHYKSLDHRSFYFKQQDPKKLSSKALIGEIKEMKKMNEKEDDVVNDTESRRPHLRYEYDDATIHEDLQKLIRFSCDEMCSKEQLSKVMRLWSQLLEAFLGVSSSSVETEPKQTENQSVLADSVVRLTVDSELRSGPLNPSETRDEDPLAEGKLDMSLANIEVTEKKSEDQAETSNEMIMMVRKEEILGSDDKDASGEDNLDSELKNPKQILTDEHNLSNDPLRDTQSVRSIKIPESEKEEGELSPDSNMEEDNFVMTAEPQPCEDQVQEAEGDKDSPHGEEEKGMKNAEIEGKGDDGLGSISPLVMRDSQILFANDDYYVLFRLHQTLYERVLAAKRNSAAAADMNIRTSMDASSPRDRYARFMRSLYNLLDGSAGSSRFEDECRAIIGNQSYVLFTLDKLIYKLVKQLQMIANDDKCKKLLQLYEYNSHRPESDYYENARELLREDHIYRFQCSSSPTHLTVHLMNDDVIEIPAEKAVSPDKKESDKTTPLPRSHSS